MKEKDELLELDTRRDIFEHIKEYPGSYLRKMQDELDLSTGQLEYHLNHLNKKGLVSREEVGNKKRYFVNEDVDYPDREILSFLRQKVPRKVLLRLTEEGEMGFSSLQECVDISKSTLSFHLKKLKENDIIEARKEGRRKIYSCVDREKIAQVLITYKSSFIDEAVDSFVDTWTELK